MIVNIQIIAESAFDVAKLKRGLPGFEAAMKALAEDEGVTAEFSYTLSESAQSAGIHIPENNPKDE